MATDPRTVESYNQGAQEYDDHLANKLDSPFHAFYEKPAIRAELPELEDLDVISIGCGSGRDTSWLKEQGARNVAGIDISEELISIGNKNFPELDLRVMDMEQLEFGERSFDLAYSSLAIHYLDDWTLTLKETYRILKPGGQYVFSCGHPIESAMEYTKTESARIAKLGKTVPIEDSVNRVIHGDYLVADHDGVRQINAQVGGFDVVAYHQPISKMLEQIINSGFTIKKMVEPLPVDEMADKDPKHFEQLRKIPFFMIWVLKK